MTTLHRPQPILITTPAQAGRILATERHINDQALKTIAQDLGISISHLSLLERGKRRLDTGLWINWSNIEGWDIYLVKRPTP